MYFGNYLLIMRAQFVRGIDPKDSMNIGNKHAREAQKLMAAFKEIDPSLEPKITDDKTQDQTEMVVVSVFKDKKIIKSPKDKFQKDIYSLSWVKSGLEFYMASTSYMDRQITFSKLEKAKEKMKEYLK